LARRGVDKENVKWEAHIVNLAELLDALAWGEGLVDVD
jgi:hypothetical protein